MWIRSLDIWLNLDYVCMVEDTERVRNGGSGEKDPALVIKINHGDHPLDFVLYGEQREKALDVLRSHDTKVLRQDSDTDLKIVSL